MEFEEQPDAYISEVRYREAHWFSDWDGTIPSAVCKGYGTIAKEVPAPLTLSPTAYAEPSRLATDYPGTA